MPLKLVSAVVIITIIAGVVMWRSIPLPYEWSEEFIEKNSSYYFSNSQDWENNHNFLEIVWVTAVNFKIGYDWKQHLNHQIKDLPEDTALQISAITDSVRQLYIPKYQADVGLVANSSIASLVRGYGYCDQVNGTLAYILHDYLDDVQMVGINNAENNPHTVVQTKSSLGTVYADAFTCTTVFGFYDSLTTLGKASIPTHQELRENLYPHWSYLKARPFNSFDWKHLSQKAHQRLQSILLFSEPPQKSSSGTPEEFSVPSSSHSSPNSNSSTEVKKIFLKARLANMYGRKKDALYFYRLVADQHEEKELKTISTFFLKRLADNNPLCH